MKPVEHYLSPPVLKTLKRQGYYLFGHSAVKACHYTNSAISKGKQCYKHQFYGIESAQCAQMTVESSICDMKCSYCWRPIFGKEATTRTNWEEPIEILEETIRGHQKLLSGFGGHPNAETRVRHQISQHVKHIAISLAGEPTLYPRLGEFIDECHRRGISTFLVSNGQHPEALRMLQERNSLPTQLYISIDTGNPEVSQQLNRPSIPDSWQRISETMELLSSLNCRKVIRVTCVKGINMNEERQLAQFLWKAKPNFIELKGYSYIGFSRARLQQSNSPGHADVKSFSQTVLEQLNALGANYSFQDEFEDARVCLLWDQTMPLKIDFESFFAKAQSQLKEKGFQPIPLLDEVSLEEHESKHAQHAEQPEVIVKFGMHSKPNADVLSFDSHTL